MASMPESQPQSGVVVAGRFASPVRRREASLVRREEARAKSTSIAVASSLFLLLLAAALLIGGHTILDPLLQSAVAARQAAGKGELVYTMPDGVYCRHMTFDNMSEEIIEGGLELCPSSGGRSGSPDHERFNWVPR